MINLELNFLTVFFWRSVTFAPKHCNIATKFAIIGGLCISHFVFEVFNSKISVYPVHFWSRFSRFDSPLRLVIVQVKSRRKWTFQTWEPLLEQTSSQEKRKYMIVCLRVLPCTTNSRLYFRDSHARSVRAWYSRENRHTGVGEFVCLFVIFS